MTSFNIFIDFFYIFSYPKKKINKSQLLLFGDDIKSVVLYTTLSLLHSFISSYKNVVPLLPQ